MIDGSLWHDPFISEAHIGRQKIAQGLVGEGYVVNSVALGVGIFFEPSVKKSDSMMLLIESCKGDGLIAMHDLRL